MDNLKRKPDNATQFLQIERALSAFLSDDFFQNGLLINLKIHTSVAVFGILANVFNIVVFVKQGFKDTVNISLTSLALSDLASLVFLAWMSLCNEPIFKSHVRSTFDSIDIAYLTGGIPRTYFTLVGGWITSLISMERCVSVIRPLHVKFLFTKRRLVVINAFIFVTVSGPYFPVFYASRLTTKTDPASNMTYVGLTFIEEWQTFNFLFSFIGLVMSVCTFAIVCACATVIVLALVKQRKWRAQMAHGSCENPELSTADNERKVGRKQVSSNMQINDTHKVHQPSKSNKKSKKKTITGSFPGNNRATKTVIMIAILFIICYLPGTINKLAMTFVSDYSRAGRYSNVFKFFWSVSFVAEAICSSVNVFVYMGTNTKFKETIINSFRCCCALGVAEVSA